MEEQKVCPVAKKCGGCSWQGISYEEQLKKKQKQIRKLLKNICPVAECARRSGRRRAVYHLAAYRRTADLDDRRLLSAGVPAVPHAGCGVEQLFYPVDRRSGAQDQHHRQGDRGRTLRRAAAEDL